MKVQNSLSAQLASINLNQANIVKIVNAYLEAITTSKQTVSVTLESIDGTTTQVSIPTNTYLHNELEKLTASFKNVVGLSNDSKARLIASDGTFRELLVSSFSYSMKPEASDVKMLPQISVSTNSTVESLISPLTAVNIELSDRFATATSVYITKIVTSDLTGLTNGMHFGECKRILSVRKQQFEQMTYTLPVRSKRTRYYGSFNVKSITANDDSTFTLSVDKITYSDSNNLYENTRTLTQDDTVTNADGTALYTVLNAIAGSTASQVKLKQISGVGIINPNEQMHLRPSESISAVISVPVRLNEKSIIFLEVVDKTTNSASAMSSALVFDSNTFTVEQNGIVTKFNDYFVSKVADIGRYIESMVRENMLPASLGVQPATPVLVQEDFNVVQINKHLTNTPNVEKMRKIASEKDVAMNKIQVLASNISELQKRISEGNYNSDAKKNADVSLLNTLIADKVRQTTLASSLVQDLRVLLNENSNASIQPKYRVRGFWEVPKPLVNDVTSPQHIVQYEIRYMYVSNAGKVSNADTMTYTAGANTVNAVFSSWNFYKTEPLQRQIDADGVPQWVANSPSDGEKRSINEIDIPINFGESVEFQIRAISEAGWPTSPLMSEWSNVVRVGFPEELLYESDIAALQRQNSADTLKVEIMNEFASQGITKHIAKSFTEQEKYFAHTLDEIASGMQTAEQRQISALTYIQNLENKIKMLDEIVNRRYAQLSVQLLDGNTLHDITNGSTLSLFAGNYTDFVDMSNASNYGTIVEKTYVLRIANKSQQTIELLSIDPGPLKRLTENSKYNRAGIMQSDGSVIRQHRGQIWYQRNVDVTGSDAIMFGQQTSVATVPPTSEIDGSAIDAQKNVVFFDGASANRIALIPSAVSDNFVTISTSHEAYNAYQQTNDVSVLQQTFDRLKHFTTQYASKHVLPELHDDTVFSYLPDDKFLIGKPSCGATMFCNINAITSHQIFGTDSASSKEVYTGEENAILVPIKFQYRMTDALGRKNGTGVVDTTNAEYTKTMGIDLLIAGKIFSFDLNVTARYRATSATNNVIGLYSQATNSGVKLQ